MKLHLRSLLKPTMCHQAQAWSRGFATVNSIPGRRGSPGDKV